MYPYVSYVCLYSDLKRIVKTIKLSSAYLEAQHSFFYIVELNHCDLCAV